MFVGVIYYQDILVAAAGNESLSQALSPISSRSIRRSWFSWARRLVVVLNNESRQVAQEESGKQTALLLKEIEEHKKTDSMLQETREAADRPKPKAAS